MEKRIRKPKEKLYEELVIDVKSVVKVNKGDVKEDSKL